MSELDTPKLSENQVSLDLPHEHYRSNSGTYSVAFSDLLRGLHKVSVWSALAWEEIISPYKRAFLGILWPALGFMIFTVCFVFFRIAITGQYISDHALWIVFGFLSFQLIISGINDGTMVFIQSANWLKSSRLPFSLFIYKGITRAIIMFFFNCIGAVLIVFFLEYVPTSTAWLALLGLMVTVLNAVWVYMLLGVLCARYRDLGHLISSISRILLFVSPVLWEPGQGGVMSLVARLNPISYFMEVVRGPLLGQDVPIFTWQVIGGITVGGFIVAFFAFAHFRKKLILWI